MKQFFETSDNQADIRRCLATECDRGVMIMQRMCRNFLTRARRRRQLSELLRHATIVTDRKRLAYLSAELAKRKRRNP